MGTTNFPHEYRIADKRFPEISFRLVKIREIGGVTSEFLDTVNIAHKPQYYSNI